MSDVHGLLVIDKPAGITSRDAVNRAAGWFPRGTRLGHTGTLDPLATGVLVLCIGKATRLAEYVQRMQKTYRARIVLGARSDTDDADGTITPVADTQAPRLDEVRARLAALVGSYKQVPPSYSAAKVTGQRAYDLARRGTDVSLAARVITVYAIDLLRYEYPHLEVEVRCGKGTYIRSLARDLGEHLGCGGYIQSLRRTCVGGFDVAAAITLDTDAAAAQRAMLPMALAVAELPRLTLVDAEIHRLRQGQSLPLPASEPSIEEIAVLDRDGALIAVSVVDRKRHCLRPGKVMVGPP